MLVVDVYNHRFHKIFNPSDPLTQIMDRDDIFVYDTNSDTIVERHFEYLHFLLGCVKCITCL